MNHIFAEKTEMIIAREKKRTNIAEYILYMWQVEDMIRACKLNIDLIEKHIISQMKLDELQREESLIWYADLVEKMKIEKITKKGHLSFVNDLINKLNRFHLDLLNDKSETKYKELYKWAKINIDDLREKSRQKGMNDILITFTGLYGLLVLRLKKQNISEGTSQAMQTFSNMLAYLSAKFLKSGVQF